MVEELIGLPPKSRTITDNSGNQYVICNDCRSTIPFCNCEWRKQ